MSDKDNKEFDHREMAEHYIDDAELHLDYVREDLDKQNKLGLALINLSVAKYDIELLEYTIKQMQKEATDE